MEIREPFIEELPSSYADYLGLYYTSNVTNEHKKNLGQFFTPIEIANFMAQFCVIKNKGRIKILDPGCGIGILSCALAEKIANNPEIKEIELVAFETDLEIINFAERSFSYLREWLKLRNINFIHFLCANDFVLHNSVVLSDKTDTIEKFDIVISNPPYFKIRKDNPVAIAAESIIYGQTNIYTIFLILSAKLLVDNGQLVFIIPRSFTSGSYFRLFREIFFSLVSLRSIHLFASRKDAFQRDKILQENVIVSAYKKKQDNAFQLLLPFESDINNNLEISISNGSKDINEKALKSYKFIDLVNLESYQKILHLPTSKNDEQAIKIFKKWKHSLSSFKIEISTGPVIAFRSTKFISEEDTTTCVPLIWLHNINKMSFEWPLTYYKGKIKGQYIKACEESSSRLLPNKNYVFLRRFSSKDDKSKLIASPYFKTRLSATKLGVENHLNYIYKRDGELLESETVGIAALLNSSLFDIYFRTFNGNINVSATELRDMPFPSLNTIQKIGERVLASEINDQNIIDQILFDTFRIKLN